MSRRPLRLGLPKLLGIVSAQLQEPFGPQLESYVNRARLTGGPSGAKVINDPVWRTVRVEAWELLVLDSPIFQRIRHIHQLGLAGWVFPGANYSRFEHSVGVLHQVQRLIEAINRNARAYAARHRVPPVIRVGPADEVILRLAALLHDTGHGFFSHVSERVMSRFASIDGQGSIDDFRVEARHYFKTTSVPAVAEVLASLMTLLPEFGDVLELAQPPTWQDTPEELAWRIAQVISGGRAPTRPFLTEIISGALDADKLDYMPRDCYMAGLPMPIDVDRLLEKIQVVSVTADRLPPAYAAQYGLEPTDSVELLAVQTGGARAFEELVVSRVLLYDKLYNHQKIRALEGMVENALDLLGSSLGTFRKFSTYLTMTDADFISGRWPEEEDTTSAQCRQARKIIDAILRRQTYVRAFAFGPGLISSPDPRDPGNEAFIRASWAAIRPLVTRSRSHQALDFRKDVVRLAAEYLTAMGQSGLANDLKEHDLVIDLPDVQGIAEKTRFYVGDEDYGVELYNKRFRVERWAEAYENQKIVGYVFSPPEVSIAVHLAVRQLFKSKTKLSFENQSWGMTKISPLEIADACDLLRSRGQVLDTFTIPPELVSRRQYLQSIGRKQELLRAYDTMIPDLAHRFQTFQPANGDPISERHIREWLMQFDYEAIPLAITTIQHVRYWDRAALTDAFISALERQPELQSAQWLSLGGPTTSSRHLTYLWPDIKKKIAVPAGMQVLSDARDIKSDTPLILYDDNVGSGGQGTTVLQQWFSVPRDQWIIQEEHVQALDAESIARLKRCDIVFLFATGRRPGLDQLLANTRELVGHDRVRGHIVAPDDVNCFRPASRVFADSISSTTASDAFEAAGRIALADKLQRWGKDKLESRILGYGNVGGLTVFYYNVPTTTVTALWKANGQQWRSLFDRRPRD